MRLFAFIAMLFFVGLTHAQSTLTQNLSAAKLPTFSGNLGLGYNTNLYTPGSNQEDRSISGDLTLNYRVKDANLIRTYFGGFKELDRGEEWRTNDGFIGWVNNAFWSRGKVFTFGQQVRLNLPYSKESRKRDTKLFGVSVVPVVMANVAPSVLFIYQPQLIHNAHTYKTNRAGVSNTQWATNHTFVGSWSISDKVYFQPVFLYGMAWSYRGTKKDDVFQAAGELGYSFDAPITVAAGWTNTGAIRNFENGNDQTIRVFDENTSTVYAALYWVF